MPDTDLSMSDHMCPPARGLLLSRSGGCIAEDGFLPRTDGRGSSVHDQQASGGCWQRVSREQGAVWSCTNTDPNFACPG